MRLPNPLCWLAAFWRSLTTGALIGGHCFTESVRKNNCIVTVLCCEWCGRHEVLWETTARSTDEPYPEDAIEGH